mmetsp:Transcript_20318/g.47720  ORF Transcript_20318/g.47720 Transcript_20318/m.47720 type:complete len:171 (+) Transcript_20318:241-753(+)
MDKYRLVDEQYIGAQGFIDESKLGGTSAPPTDSDAETECTVRITPQAKPRSCITTAMNIFAGGNNHVELKALGKAIHKAVTIAEILKRKMPLHQINALSSCEIVTTYEPLEEGLDTVVNQHYVSCLTITLSTDLEGVDVHNIGYQPPLDEFERSSHQSHTDLTGTYVPAS